MPDKAKVTSIEALDSFRSSLIVYLEKATRVLDEISAEAMRTRVWLQDDRRSHWEKEVRTRTKKLEEKQQELFSAQLANLREVTNAEQMAVLQARRSLTAAQERLEVVKKWNREFDSRVAPLAKEVDKLRDVLISHMRKGVSYLTQTNKALADYAEVASPGSSTKTSSDEPTVVAPEVKAEER